MPASGSQRMSSPERGERVRRSTLCPPTSSSGIKADPISPFAPLTSTFMLLLHTSALLYQHGNHRTTTKPYVLSHTLMPRRPNPRDTDLDDRIDLTYRHLFV